MSLVATPLGSLWRRQRARRLLFEVAFSALVLLFLVYAALQAADLKLTFDYLSGPAGFALSHTWLVEFKASDSRLDAYLTGIVNTIQLVAIGIVLATIVGVVVGVSRLSGNWLVSSLATLYVEVIRNTPLPVQVFFWYFAAFLKLPTIENSVDVAGLGFISNRAVVLPSLDAGPFAWLWLILLALGAVSAWFVRRRRLAREVERGTPAHPNLYALGTLVAVGAVAFLATGLPLRPDLPALVVLDRGVPSFEGGFAVSPEFTALLVALVVYTGAFIAEIVRGSIQALPRGQGEAAQALGLSAYQRTTLVILPQALRTIVPPLTNQFLNLNKNSSLAILIAYPELVFVGRQIMNNVGHAVPMFILILATYIAMNLVISAAMNLLNARVQLEGS